MNSVQKPDSPGVNTRIMRLELLMRAHEVSRRISERVHRALQQGKPVTPSPETMHETGVALTLTPAVEEVPASFGPQLARQMQRGPTT